MSISVLILTLNEEENIERCLTSLNWCNDIVLLDSYSCDATEQIANKYSVRFIQRKFDNYASQRNYGLKSIQYKNKWLLMIDADEEVPADLADDMQLVVDDNESEFSLYRMRRKDYFMGRWIKRSSGYPTWFGRLMRIENAWIERDINEEFHTDGKVGFLQNHLNHYPFNKGLSEWLNKHNRYSSMEALHRLTNDKDKFNWSYLMSSDPQQRRIIVKQLFYALPMRPVFTFLALYLVRGGLFEGKAGFVFSSLRAIYEFMIDIKVNELRRKRKKLPL